MSLEVILLAAGKGSRMKSTLPKVLHSLAGKTMLNHQLNTIDSLDGISQTIVVVGHEKEQIRKHISNISINHKISLIEQKEQLGTGHATMQASPLCKDESIAVIIAGDVPFISPDTIINLYHSAKESSISLLETEMENPFGYGRLLKDDTGFIQKIVEEKDANKQQKLINNVYCGILAVKASLLKKLLKQITNDNTQGEYYLPSIIELAIKEGYAPKTVRANNIFDYFGINDQQQLSYLNRMWQKNKAEHLLKDGVAISDPLRFDLRGVLQYGNNVSIDINAILVGNITLEDNVSIGANSYIENSIIKSNTVIEPFSHISHANIGKNCSIGPFARIRAGSNFNNNVKIGNFVETKNTKLDEGSKVNHLSYLGDTSVGSNSNIGAGTITCNYNGVKKQQTKIGNNAFVGSNSSLIAPLDIGDNATIAAGSVINKDVCSKSLAISRAKQRQINGWSLYNTKT